MRTFTSLREAAAYAGVSYQAVRNWAAEYGIGTFDGTRWTIDGDKLDRVIELRARAAEARADIRKVG